MPGRNPIDVLRRLIDPGTDADFIAALAEADEQRRRLAEDDAVPTISPAELDEIDRLVWRASATAAAQAEPHTFSEMAASSASLPRQADDARDWNRATVSRVEFSDGNVPVVV